MSAREIKGYWWTWIEGEDWPSWYYGESAARVACDRLAKGSPGRRILVGNLMAVEMVTLPDQLVREDLHS